MLVICSKTKIQKEIESYEEIMEQRPKYKIWYNLEFAFDSKVNRGNTKKY